MSFICTPHVRHWGRLLDHDEIPERIAKAYRDGLIPPYTPASEVSPELDIGTPVIVTQGPYKDLRGTVSEVEATSYVVAVHISPWTKHRVMFDLDGVQECRSPEPKPDYTLLMQILELEPGGMMPDTAQSNTVPITLPLPEALARKIRVLCALRGVSAQQVLLHILQDYTDRVLKPEILALIAEDNPLSHE